MSEVDQMEATGPAIAGASRPMVLRAVERLSAVLGVAMADLRYVGGPKTPESATAAVAAQPGTAGMHVLSSRRGP